MQFRIWLTLVTCTASAQVIVAPINTLADWFLDPSAPFLHEPFDRTAVDKIIDRHKAAGVKRLAWRVTDGGTATYFSKLREPYHRLQPVNIHKDFFLTPASVDFTKADFRKFDSFRYAIERAHAAGIELYAWMQVAGEDDGWGYASRRVIQHPEVNTVGRDKVRFNAKLAWSMPENRKYLLGLIEEVLAYQPDGLILDFLKNQGDYRNQLTDSAGTAVYGYEPHAVREFEKRFKKDPFQLANDNADWVRFRAGYVTEFAREARQFVRKKSPRARLVAQVWGGGLTSHFVKKANPKPGGPKYEIVPYPVRDALYGTLCDVETWSREGLFDAIYPLVSTKDIEEYRSRLRTVQRLVSSGNSKAAAGAYIWGQAKRTKEFVQAAVDLRISEIYLGESLPLEPDGWAVLRETIEAVR